MSPKKPTWRGITFLILGVIITLSLALLYLIGEPKQFATEVTKGVLHDFIYIGVPASFIMLIFTFFKNEENPVTFIALFLFIFNITVIILVIWSGYKLS